MCNGIDSNFAIGVFLRDLSFANWLTFDCESSLLENDKGMNWKIVQFFFCWLKPNNDIFITKKPLSNDWLLKSTILPAVVFWNNENNDIQIKFFFGINTFGWFYCKKLANRLITKFIISSRRTGFRRTIIKGNIGPAFYSQITAISRLL